MWESEEWGAFFHHTRLADGEDDAQYFAALAYRCSLLSVSDVEALVHL
jgi:hypothetical protein